MMPEHGPSQVITFYSFKGGVGRTMALANVAWILASTGRRVLTVDWDLESPGLHRYFSPFLADRDLRQSPGVINAMIRFASAATQSGDRALESAEIRRLARIKDFATSLDRYEFPEGGSIDFVPAGQQVAEYSRMVSHFDWDHFYTQLNGEEFLVALADDMRSHYDVTLIDSRTGLSDNAGICTVALPDAVVNCFGFNNQSIEGAVAIARNIRRLRPHGVKMFPVPTRVEDGETAKLDRRRNLAQQRFGEYVAALGYPDAGKYWGAVEIPYKVFYAYEETLAAFGDRSHQESTLLAAYERLASELVGQKCAFPGISEAARHAWLAEFEQRGLANPNPLLIAYIPRDRIWAEWVLYELRSAGQGCSLQDMTASVSAADTLARADRVIVLLSRESMHAPQTRIWWDIASKQDTPAIGRFLVPVHVDGYRLAHPFDTRESLEMININVRRARGALLSRLDLREVVEAEVGVPSAPSPRFPFDPARVWQVPARNSNFVGRDAALEELRGRLNSSNAMAGPAVLQGIGGVGKTQIAAEYLHRFAADYDIAWWISADQPALVATGLADLAQKLELPVAPHADDQIQLVLETLRLGLPSHKWIIVFDNTVDPDQLRPYIPTGNGDVIVTTPGQEWSRYAWTLDVNVFDRSESVSLLTRRVNGLTAEDADAIAAKLGDLPLAIEQAAALLEATAMSASSYMEILDENIARILNEPPPPGYRHAVAETWRLSQRRLRQATPAAAVLVELCAFLAPEPIPTDLLDSSAMVEALAAIDPALRDKLLRSSLVREITRFGLARVDSVVWSDSVVRALKMHRLVQSVIRSDLSEEQQAIRQEQIHVILAKAHPGEPADQRNWLAYQGLLAHLEPSNVLDSEDFEARQLVIDMVRYLRYRGDLTSAQGLAERAIARWLSRSGEDDIYVLRMRSELANALLEHGEYQQSVEMYADVVARMSKSLGPRHPYTLVALGGQAAGYRGVGKYIEARELDEQTFAHWHAVQGDDGERTLMAANNLAISLRLLGDFAAARQRDEDTLSRYERAMPNRQHRWTLLSRVAYGRDLREVGELVQSQAVLERAVTDCHKELRETDSISLSASKSLAVTLRRLGQTEESRQVIEKTFAQYQRVFTASHSNLLNCELELACIESAQGNHEAAYTRAQDVLARYQRALGRDHPFTIGAANDVAIFLLQQGDHEKAKPILVDAIDRFTAKLVDHPYTVFCQMNLANAKFAAGEIESARQLDEECMAKLLRWFANRSHPTLLAAAANFIASKRASGDHSGAEQLRETTLRIAEESYGSQHPHTVAIRDGERINIDIEHCDEALIV